jgi:hypothetical protein
MNDQRTTVMAYDASELAAAALRCAARRAGPGARLVVAYAANAPAHFIGTAYRTARANRDDFDRGSHGRDHLTRYG